MTTTTRTLSLCTCLLLWTASSAPAVTSFFGPTGPYLQASDSPFDGLPFLYFHLEDHEDGELNTPGVSVDAGTILAPGTSTDSVDGDDGVLDGSGTAGYSWFAGIGDLTMTYTFDAGVLGELPTHAGVVYTNAFALEISVEAFDENDVSVGSSTPAALPATVTSTAVFVGAQHDAGIRRLAVTFTFTGGGSTIEVDHLQYGSTGVIVTTTTTSTTTSTTTTSTTTTSTTSTTTTSTTSTTTTSSTTTSTVPPSFISGKKLQVKQKKSGAQKMILLAKDPAVAATNPCEVGGTLIIESVGVQTAAMAFPLDAALWKPIKKKKPEKGCKYRKGPVAATVLIKTGKLLKVIASSTDLGIPLGTDPSPVRIEVRHGDARHCLEFGTGGKHVADRKLLVKNAAPASTCPGGSPSGAFLD